MKNKKQYNMETALIFNIILLFIFIATFILYSVNISRVHIAITIIEHKTPKTKKTHFL